MFHSNKIRLFIAMLLVLALPGAYAANEQDYINALDVYYSSFAQKDIDRYLDAQFLDHLDAQPISDKRENVLGMFKTIDILSYTIDKFKVEEDGSGVGVATYVVTTRIGQVIEGKPETIEYTNSMTAVIADIEGKKKIMVVMPTELFDLSMNAVDSQLVFELEPVKQEEGIFSIVKSFFSKVIEMVAPKPKSCGNYVCDAKENVRNCAEDCRKLVFAPECGNQVCSLQETYETCPYDCAPTENLNNSKQNKTVVNESKKEYPTTEEKLPVIAACGDSKCDKGMNESCSNCVKDCGCKEGECTAGECSIPVCTPKATIKCYNNDEWYYNSCGVKETKKTACDNGCENTTCKVIACTSKAKAKCYNNDVWYYNSCNIKETRKMKCDNGCENATCKAPACTAKASIRCYNGDVWYYNSCDLKETKKENCDNGCEDSKCIEEEESDVSFRTGTATLPSFNSGEDYTTIPYSTFDFTRGRTIEASTEANDNDVRMLFGKAGDLGTACNGYVCPMLKKETSLAFDNMNSHPGGDGDPHAQPSPGDRYWVLMIDDNSKYGKIEIIELQGGSDSYTGIKFKWAFYP
jgi:uncharacterized protein YjhX (UPF0386 family)